MADFGVPPRTPESDVSDKEKEAREYGQELRTTSERQKEASLYRGLSLAPSQQDIFDYVKNLIDSHSPPTTARIVYLDGPAGTGKTHVYCKLLHYVRMTGRIALAVAMSGIAALLLPGGRTAHSRFRLPVPVPLEGCKANVKPQSAAGRLLRDASLLVWDESPTASKAMFEAVDKCLQDIMDCTLPFGGKTIVLGGDFRQIPPVLRYIDRHGVIAHTVAAMPWWHSGHVKRFHLTENMRAHQDKPYAQFCHRLGDGA